MDVTELAWFNEGMKPENLSMLFPLSLFEELKSSQSLDGEFVAYPMREYMRNFSRTMAEHLYREFEEFDLQWTWLSLLNVLKNLIFVLMEAFNFLTRILFVLVHCRTMRHIPEKNLHVSTPTWWLESRFHFRYGVSYGQVYRSYFCCFSRSNNNWTKRIETECFGIQMGSTFFFFFNLAGRMMHQRIETKIFRNVKFSGISGLPNESENMIKFADFVYVYAVLQSTTTLRMQNSVCSVF